MQCFCMIVSMYVAAAPGIASRETVRHIEGASVGLPKTLPIDVKNSREKVARPLSSIESENDSLVQ